jgi:putative flippase GtrA
VDGARPKRAAILSWAKRAYDSWATRSLAVGAIATALDVCVLLVCVRLLHLSNPEGAMCGVAVGGTFAFFANRHFAFRDHTPELAPQAAKFIAATGGAMLIHAVVVWFLADRLGIPVVIAKLLADVAVFSVGQLLVLRYVVFPSASSTKGRFNRRRSIPMRSDIRRFSQHAR